MSDTLDLIGVLGTWLAVVLASLALLGVVAPLLVLKAIYSNRIQALNAVHDIDEDFVTRGIGYGRNFRLFHRVKVPQMVPLVDWSRSSTFTVYSAEQPWLFEHRKDTSCRTGWARMCRLLEAHGLLSDSKGSLVVEGQRILFPVSRYYILTVGLLGRYGRRSDEGKVMNITPLRSELDELRHFQGGGYGRPMPPPQQQQHQQPIMKHPMQGPDRAGPGCISSDDEMDNMSIISFHRVDRFPGTMYGTTGSFQIKSPVHIGNDNSTPKTIITFTAHNTLEMGALPETASSNIKSPTIRHLYWLASGFLPLNEEETVVASLQSPHAALKHFQINAFGEFTVVKEYELDDDESSNDYLSGYTSDGYESEHSVEEGLADGDIIVREAVEADEEEHHPHAVLEVNEPILTNIIDGRPVDGEITQAEVGEETELINDQFSDHYSVPEVNGSTKTDEKVSHSTSSDFFNNPTLRYFGTLRSI